MNHQQLREAERALRFMQHKDATTDKPLPPVAGSPLPCPFCGTIPQYLTTGSVSQPDILLHRFLCISGSCGVQPFSGWHLTADEAATVWNQRSPANS